jgi:hypothetical protein
MTDDPLACPFEPCPFIGTDTADLQDHLIIKRFTDPDVHDPNQP